MRHNIIVKLDTRKKTASFESYGINSNVKSNCGKRDETYFINVFLLGVIFFFCMIHIHLDLIDNDLCLKSVLKTKAFGCFVLVWGKVKW